MKELRTLIACGALALAPAASAVYAPIPEQEQGKDLTYSVRAGISYDNNLFGAPPSYTVAAYTDGLGVQHAAVTYSPVGSFIYEVAPGVNFNASLSQQTFVSASYRLTLDYIENRPGSRFLDGHDATFRLAHALSQASSIDLNDAFKITRDPASLLNGVPINTDQSYLSNQFDGRFTTALTEKDSIVVKARSIYYDYFNTVLGNELNRFENLYGVEGTYAYLPELKLAAEYRHQDVDYRADPSANNKHSEFAMAGFDYQAGPKLSVTLRLGAEFRRRDGGLGHETAPYAEFSGKYSYAKESFFAAGYIYDLTETSDPIHFTDERTHHFFVNVQHALSARIVASASLDYEPGTLLGRADFKNVGPGGNVVSTGYPNVSETGTHDGLALSYLPNKNWTISATYDYDHVSSGLFFRQMDRSRGGVNATLTF
jgi:hypothetical protein